MRVSANNPEHYNARVYIDGSECSSICTEADDIEGWANVIVKNSEGHFLVEYDGRPVIGRIFGEVVIEL